VIINGGSRSNGAFFARHLMRADQNERVSVEEIRGLAAQNVRDAFAEMEAVASGTRCKNYFYTANLNPREGEVLTPQQWEQAADTLEHELGLDGQPRFVVQHEKDGRVHRHIVWSRIDADSMTAISDSLSYPKHERAAREMEQAFGHEPVESVLVKDRGTERPERNAQDWESFRGQESRLDPKAIKAEVTELWHAADSGTAFAAALHEHGYILARGDRRDFCIVDQAGDEHSLARRISGAKAAEIRARMGDIDRDALPTVAEARAMAREATGGDAAFTPQPEVLPATEPPEAPQAATPEITPEIERDLAARFDDWQPLERGAASDSPDLAQGVQATSADLEHGALPADTGDEHRGWRRFADRVRGFQARAIEFWHDETSGTPEGERGFAARLFDAGRHLVGGWRRRDGVELVEGIEEAVTLARDLAADGTGGGGTPPETSGSGGDARKSFADRIRDQGRALWQSERGSVPGDDFDRLAAEWTQALPPDAASAPPNSAEPAEPATPEAWEPDSPEPDDGPDIE
jgi:hypothetical protein